MIFLKLKETIRNTGKIEEQYGGFDILVLDNKEFPWASVFEMLIDSGFQIWISKKSSHIEIISKPEVG